MWFEMNWVGNGWQCPRIGGCGESFESNRLDLNDIDRSLDSRQKLVSKSPRAEVCGKTWSVNF